MSYASEQGVLNEQMNAAMMAFTAAQNANRTEEMRQETEREYQRPFMQLKPKMLRDGNQWCALYGDNLQEGVCAFGETPFLAAKAFDEAWLYPAKDTQ